MPSRLRAYLAGGQSLLMLNPGKAALPEQLADVDAVFVDREGTGLSLEQARDAVDEAGLRRLAAIVRTDGLSPAELTASARLAPDGVVLPQVVSAEQLDAAVTLLRPFGLGIIAQIETVDAVEKLPELMTLDGVDAFLIGPNDLAAAMGFAGAPDHEVVQSTIDAVAAQLSTAGRVFGLPTLTRAAREEWAARGAALHYVPLNAFLAMETEPCP